MWRAFFLAIGVSVFILGVECLGVEQINLHKRDAPPPVSPWDPGVNEGPQITLTPPRWAPWSLMGSGAVVCLYSFTIPRRIKGE